MSDFSDTIKEEPPDVKLTKKGTLIYGEWSREKLIDVLTNKLTRRGKQELPVCDDTLLQVLHCIIHSGIYDEHVLRQIEGRGRYVKIVFYRNLFDTCAHYLRNQNFRYVTAQYREGNEIRSSQSRARRTEIFRRLWSRIRGHKRTKIQRQIDEEIVRIPIIRGSVPVYRHVRIGIPGQVCTILAFLEWHRRAENSIVARENYIGYTDDNWFSKNIRRK